jgi:hypothetical protein
MPDDDANAIGVANIGIRVAVRPIGLLPCYKSEPFLEFGLLPFARGDLVDRVGVPFEHLIDKVVGLFARPKCAFGDRIFRDLQIAGLYALPFGIEPVNERAVRPFVMPTQRMAAVVVFLL